MGERESLLTERLNNAARFWHLGPSLLSQSFMHTPHVGSLAMAASFSSPVGAYHGGVVTVRSDLRTRDFCLRSS